MAIISGTVLVLSFIALTWGDQTKNPYFRKYHSINLGNKSIGGTEETINAFGTDYNLRNYRGIPYAEPPVGKLRFKPPVPKVLPDGYNATGFGDSCLQNSPDLVKNDTLITDPMYHTKQSEDCLYLNIYSPADASPTKTKAVLVFFQARGGWVAAAGHQHNGMVLSALGDIIVVTFNYRLGVFGFLQTGVKGSGANFGVQDQQEVIRWVSSNIQYFGGDKDRVTIFGIRTGCVDVTLHAAFIGKTEKLIRRVICSGKTAASSIPTGLEISDNPGRASMLLAEFTGCKERAITSVAETERLFECLRGKTAAEVFQASLKVARKVLEPNSTETPPWGPSVDGSIIKFHPSVYYRTLDPRYQPQPTLNESVLIGIRYVDGAIWNRIFEERLIFFSAANLTPPVTKLSETVLKTILLPRLFIKLKNRDRVAKASFQEYFAGLPSDASYDTVRKDRFTEMIQDLLSSSGLIGIARIRARVQNGRTFMYHFTQEDPTLFQGQTLSRSLEQTYVLGDIALVNTTMNVRPNVTMDTTENITSVDKDMTIAMINYFANFVKFGDPNGNMSDASRPNTYPEWPEFTAANHLYMDIGSNSTSLVLNVKKDLRAKQASFWLEYIPYIMGKTCTVPESCETKCPSLEGRNIGDLDITVGQAQAVIVILAVGTAVSGCLSLILLSACSKLRKQVKLK
ncbi:carboxylesterase 1E-like [Lineus longissimus]|uniref:carboxylesterase 1E-like n=1 Tax=Lineus longissimus TaxID=88925 RepID=UPI002B4D3062